MIIVNNNKLLNLNLNILGNLFLLNFSGCSATIWEWTLGAAFPPVSPFHITRKQKVVKQEKNGKKKILSSKWVPSTHFLVEIYNTCHCCKTPQLVFCDTLSLSCCNMLQIPNICFNSLPPLILFSCMSNILVL